MGSRLYPTPQLSLQRNSLFVLVARQEGWEPRGIFDSLHISLSAFPLLHRAVVHLLLPLSSILRGVSKKTSHCWMPRYFINGVFQECTVFFETPVTITPVIIVLFPS